MAQEIKILVRPGISNNLILTKVEKEFAFLSKNGGWKLKDTFYLGTEKNGGHNVMFVLLRDVDIKSEAPVEEATRRGRPKNVAAE